MYIILLFLFAILSAVGCEELNGCPSSMPTVSNVHRCPGNISDWIKASKRKRCSLVKQNCSTNIEFQYHCLINAEINGLVEVCIPIRRIVGNFCPFYDSKKAKIENHYHLSCKEHIFRCPEHYQSNEAYKYQGCYMAVYDQQFSNTSKIKEDTVDNYVVFRKIGDKLVDLQKDTNWTLIAIITAIVSLWIFGFVRIILRLMRPETKQSCIQCCPFRCCECCYTDNQGYVQQAKINIAEENTTEQMKNTEDNEDKDGAIELQSLVHHQDSSETEEKGDKEET